MRGDGDLDARRVDEPFLAEADHTGRSPPRPSVVDAVEIDEVDRLTSPVRVSDTRSQAAGDIREVRVGVARLYRALIGVQVGAPLQPIVLVAGTFRKQRAKGIDIRGDVLGAQFGRKAAIEKSCRRVKGPVEAARKLFERLMFGREPRP